MRVLRRGQSLLVALIVTFVVAAFLSAVVGTLYVWDGYNDLYQKDLQKRAEAMQVKLVSPQD